MAADVQQYKLNLPSDLAGWLEARILKSLRSKNAEIVFILREKMAAATGVQFGDEAPAAAPDTSARQGADITNG